ncbi:MAG: hypothetical protein R3186_11805, partial [Ruegeria sp.]|nr:hypothetical protein [Ruegeria sp.]
MTDQTNITVAKRQEWMGLLARAPEDALITRPLDIVEAVLLETQQKLRATEETAEKEADDNIDALKSDFQGKLDRIEELAHLDENAKKQLK